MSLVARLFLITAIIVTVTDGLIFIHLKQHPDHLTLKYLILVIVVTIVPIGINFWFHSR